MGYLSLFEQPFLENGNSDFKPVGTPIKIWSCDTPFSWWRFWVNTYFIQSDDHNASLLWTLQTSYMTQNIKPALDAFQLRYLLP